LGLQVGLAATVTAAMVPEGDFGALWLHELRLVRTVRGVAPLGLAGSVLQYPLFWTLLTLLLPGDGNPRLAVFVVVWLVRAVCAREIDRALAGMVVRGSPPTAAWLLPIRDVLSVMEVAASFVTNRVVWRGFRMKA
jgi:ceramide glucosyltransferase